MGKRDVPYDLIIEIKIALCSTYPERYGVGEPEDFDLLLERMLWAAFLSPQAWARVGKEYDWNSGWIHAVGRDRRNTKAIKAAVAAGETHFQGKRIFNRNSALHDSGEPYVMRWTDEEVTEVWLDIQGLANLESIVRIEAANAPWNRK
ncbi:MAG: hypothetical protein WA639_10825 [Candidatus Acidiferrum sp.]